MSLCPRSGKLKLMVKLCSFASTLMSAASTKYSLFFAAVMTTKVLALLQRAFVHYVPCLIILPLRTMWTSRPPLIHPAAIKTDSANIAAAAALQRRPGQLESKRYSELLVASKQNFCVRMITVYFATVLQGTSREQERTKASLFTIASLWLPC